MKLSILRVALSSFLLPGCLLLESGCSYAFVHGPVGPDMAVHPQGQRRLSQAATCTTSNALPIVDTVMGVLLVGAGGTLLVAAAAENKGSCSSATNSFCALGSEMQTGEIWIGLGAVALGTVYLASAVTGYGRTADCRRLEESVPSGPQASARYLLDLNAITEVRGREERESF